MPERQDHLQQARRLVRAFLVLHTATASYSREHPAVEPAVREMLAAASGCAEEGIEASIGLREGDALYVGDLRLRPDATGQEALYYTLRILRTCRIGLVTFVAGVSPREITDWFYLLHEVSAAEADDPFALLEAGMERSVIGGILVTRIPEKPILRDAVAAGDARRKAAAAYARALQSVAGILADVRGGKTVRLRGAKRRVQEIIDLLLTAETELLGLTTIRCHAAYTPNHPVNVAVLSLALGLRAGLSRASLVDLGLAALLHDVGKASLFPALLDKPGDFTAEEWEVIRRHPVYGVREMLRLREGIDRHTVRVMLGSFEHHLRPGSAGYPDLPGPRRTSLCGQIIAIADRYDALVSSRVYGRTPEPPERAMRLVLGESGTIFSGVLVKLFVNLLGIYPPGTLLMLDAGELAVVIRNNADPEKWDKPLVKVIATAKGTEIDGPDLDLSDPYAGRRISCAIDALKYGIDVSCYFL